ncbi:MAG: hypothetical protein Kow0074_22250 [Candidatus Zixiibacteriota bacterium]
MRGFQDILGNAFSFRHIVSARASVPDKRQGRGASLRLPDAQRQHVVETLIRERFRDQVVRQV